MEEENTNLTHTNQFHDVYNEQYVSELVDDDAISSQEAAFLAGYEEALNSAPNTDDIF